MNRHSRLSKKNRLAGDYVVLERNVVDKSLPIMMRRNIVKAVDLLNEVVVKFCIERFFKRTSLSCQGFTPLELNLLEGKNHYLEFLIRVQIEPDF